MSSTSTTTTHKALFLESKFGEFIIKDIPTPTPGPGEVLIKVKATALNPIDWKMHRYGIYLEHYPALLGCELAGDVEDVGEGVERFKKGDRVFVQADLPPAKASFQQYAIALAATTALIPESLSYDEAASIPVGLSTAYAAFFNPNPTGLGLEQPTSTNNTNANHAGEPIVVLGGL
ncbi:hypothetical protein CVT24_008835 [Panaeolus cyanescens]|uniref:Enoyl reductase (ER) domain-containing protein n=1 Tax=Panaeolus cyanescens TaxID=181874 RepID=A0A409VK84_9AGAR|nr:hypothetical protein CVT24_008835 [Panaeolus cyanescens]